MGLGVLMLHAEDKRAFAGDFEDANFLGTFPALIQVRLYFHLGFFLYWLLGCCYRYGIDRRSYWLCHSLLIVHFRVGLFCGGDNLLQLCCHRLSLGSYCFNDYFLLTGDSLFLLFFTSNFMWLYSHL